MFVITCSQSNFHLIQTNNTLFIASNKQGHVLVMPRTYVGEEEMTSNQSETEDYVRCLLGGDPAVDNSEVNNNKRKETPTRIVKKGKQKMLI